MFTFVTGGLRSGKSEYGLRRASELGPPPWLYVAPHIEGDDELKARLARHRRDQEAAWNLIEAPPSCRPAAAGDAGRARRRRHRSFHDLAVEPADRLRGDADYDLVAEVEALSDKLYRSTTRSSLVTTEIGLGFLPRQRARPPPDQHRRHRQPDPRRARAVGRDDGQRRPAPPPLTTRRMPLRPLTFPVGALGCNCTIVSCPETNEALVIDPGDEAPAILAALARAGLRAVKIVHTHAHFDHVMATGDVAARRAPTCSCTRRPLAVRQRRSCRRRCSASARARRPRPPPAPTLELRGDEAIAFGRREVRAIHTPGHTPGSLCLTSRNPGTRRCCSRATPCSRGRSARTDLWGGSLPDIKHSIRDRLLTLPDATLVVPGHGDETTVAAEREDNPFVGVSRHSPLIRMALDFF